MKTKNFPGRKNSRRIVALENLLRWLPPMRTPAQEEEIKTLQARILPDHTARALRTKKKR